ncbi:mechanosensitive ion channel family protein [Azospirillum rugosum]|uniref:mechanosensitive ion channel family protein n=1 Tax=Azospirillum rugosum TaxID=416170 RepID=UPI00366A8874
MLHGCRRPFFPEVLFAKALLLKACAAVLLVLGGLWLPWAAPATARDVNPLEPIDTSSPRSTLQGFLDFTNKASESAYERLTSYLASSALFLSPDEVSAIRGAIHYLEAAERTLDVSALPPATERESARRLVIQLKEVLDRIDVPSLPSVPDAEAMAKGEFKRWTLPGTEIRITRVETGPRSGDYLFDPDTVARLPEFHAKVAHLPPKSGATPGWYEFSAYRPSGVALVLHRVVPPRWILDVPGWAQVRLLDQPAWRWVGIVALLAVGLAVVRLCVRLSRSWARRRPSAARWADVLPPLGLAIVAPLGASILADVLRVSGDVYQVLTLSMWALYYGALTWATWVAGGALAESLIFVDRLRAGSIDSQLIRMVLRLLTLVVAIAILVAGADQIGLPAYSVVAGLGISGFAVALGAQQTLANLIGSIIIMVEKPFTIGNAIKVGGLEGQVESVGFRSTRIRTSYNSLATIPSSLVVNSTIDNMAVRDYCQISATLKLACDTPAALVEDFVQTIGQVLRRHPDVSPDSVQATLYDVGPQGLTVTLNAFIKASAAASELATRERILLDVLRLAESKGIRFAPPA